MPKKFQKLDEKLSEGKNFYFFHFLSTINYVDMAFSCMRNHRATQSLDILINYDDYLLCLFLGEIFTVNLVSGDKFRIFENE